MSLETCFILKLEGFFFFYKDEQQKEQHRGLTDLLSADKATYVAEIVKRLR